MQMKVLYYVVDAVLLLSIYVFYANSVKILEYRKELKKTHTEVLNLLKKELKRVSEELAGIDKEKEEEAKRRRDDDLRLVDLLYAKKKSMEKMQEVEKDLFGLRLELEANVQRQQKYKMELQKVQNDYKTAREANWNLADSLSKYKVYRKEQERQHQKLQKDNGMKKIAINNQEESIKEMKSLILQMNKLKEEELMKKKEEELKKKKEEEQRKKQEEEQKEKQEKEQKKKQEKEPNKIKDDELKKVEDEGLEKIEDKALKMEEDEELEKMEDEALRRVEEEEMEKMEDEVLKKGEEEEPKEMEDEEVKKKEKQA